MTTQKRTINQKMKKSGITRNFSLVLLGMFIAHFLFFEFIYIFLDDGGFATKYWYDFPMLTFVSLFISGFICAMIYFGMLFYNRFWKDDNVSAHIIKAILAEITFFVLLFGSVWLYFFL